MNLVEVMSLAYEAGIHDPVNLARAGAIAMAESSGNPRAHNATPPDDSYGLWQINMYGSLGPSRRQSYGLSGNDALYDPATNARVMYAISGGGKNWAPWSTYNGVRYALYLPAATAAAPGVIAGRTIRGTVDDAQAAVTGATDAAATVAQGMVKVGTWVSTRRNWERVALVVIGGTLVIGGIFVAAKPLQRGGKVVGTVLGKTVKTVTE